MKKDGSSVLIFVGRKEYRCQKPKHPQQRKSAGSSGEPAFENPQKSVFLHAFHDAFGQILPKPVNGTVAPAPAYSTSRGYRPRPPKCSRPPRMPPGFVRWSFCPIDQNLPDHTNQPAYPKSPYPDHRSSASFPWPPHGRSRMLSPC